MDRGEALCCRRTPGTRRHPSSRYPRTGNTRCCACRLRTTALVNSAVRRFVTKRQCSQYARDIDLTRKLALLDSAIADGQAGFPDNFEGWKQKSGVTLRAVLGDGSPLLAQLSNVRYSPNVRFSGMDTTSYRPAGVLRAIAILTAAKEELTLREELQDSVLADPSTRAREKGLVFIVHGRDDQRKLDFARTIQALTEIEPTILHEQPNGGKVLIERFESSAGRAGFAVVLLTADDLGRAKTEAPEQPRARQNVVFEMGFFFGALGRDRVAVFLDPGVEEPGDVRGIVYTAIDPAGAWKMTLAREMDAAGLTVKWSAPK